MGREKATVSQFALSPRVQIPNLPPFSMLAKQARLRTLISISFILHCTPISVYPTARFSFALRAYMLEKGLE